MVLAGGDFVTVKAYKPPQQHVVSYKKRSDEAWAEWAQHQFRYAFGRGNALCVGIEIRWSLYLIIGYACHTQGRWAHARGAAGVHDALHGPRAPRLPVRPSVGTSPSAT